MVAQKFPITECIQIGFTDMQGKSNNDVVFIAEYVEFKIITIFMSPKLFKADETHLITPDLRNP